MRLTQALRLVSKKEENDGWARWVHHPALCGEDLGDPMGRKGGRLVAGTMPVEDRATA